MNASLSPDRILKELADLWVSLGEEGHAETGAGVLRACTMTLVVLFDEGDDAAELGEIVAALMPEHPARTILVRLGGPRERALSHRVYSQCWMPFGQRRQICCEHVEITASDAALGDLPGVVEPLAASDLPVILWCRNPRLIDLPEFRKIAGIAGKLVVDSAAAPDPKAALARLAAEAGGQPVVADLAWTRLTRWREMLAQVFENRSNLERVPKITGAHVSFAATQGTLAWYLGAWVADALEAAGARAKVTFSRQPEGETLSLELSGDGLEARLHREDDRLMVTVNGASQCTHLPQPGEYLLMREELGIVRRDPIFERTLASAARLAYALEE